MLIFLIGLGAVLVTGRISEGLYEAIQTVERLYGTLEEELLEI